MPVAGGYTRQLKTEEASKSPTFLTCGSLKPYPREITLIATSLAQMILAGSEETANVNRLLADAASQPGHLWSLVYSRLSFEEPQVHS